MARTLPAVLLQAKAKEKHEALLARRKALERAARLRRRNGDEEEEGEEEEEGAGGEDDAEIGAALEEEVAQMSAETILAELKLLRQQLAAAQQAAAPSEAAPPETTSEKKPQRAARSLVWKCFNRDTGRCKLPSCKDPTKVCNQPPNPGTGTSGHRLHLATDHPATWQQLNMTGEIKPPSEMIEEAIRALKNKSTPCVNQAAKDELDKLAARWTAKRGRPQSITEDVELRELLARILELCKAQLRYELPCSNTIRSALKLIGAEARVIALNKVRGWLVSGVKFSMSGDLWSDSGMGLFGIYAHAMPGSFTMEKVLIGLVACESERHTGENIKQWTEEALRDMGLTPAKLLKSQPAGGLFAPLDLSALDPGMAAFDPKALDRFGVSADSTDSYAFVFKEISDNGANIKAAWQEGSRWAPCACHTLELCTIPFTFTKKDDRGERTAERGSVAESYSKARGLVGFLHRSLIGEGDFHACQERVGLPETSIDQDVRTRWRSSHNMGEQLLNNKSAVLEMDKNPAHSKPGEAWGQNKLSFLDWDHLEAGTACLDIAAGGNQLLEGDLYPTMSLVVPTVYRIIKTSSESQEVRFRNRAADEFNDER